MIVFCTHCWKETTSDRKTCPYCGNNLELDSRSFESKLVSALDHPLPETRIRICWLIGRNHIDMAAKKLMVMSQSDPDMFVRRAAVEGLSHLSSPEIGQFLECLLAENNAWLRRSVEEALRRRRGRGP